MNKETKAAGPPENDLMPIGRNSFVGFFQTTQKRDDIMQVHHSATGSSRDQPTEDRTRSGSSPAASDPPSEVWGEEEGSAPITSPGSSSKANYAQH